MSENEDYMGSFLDHLAHWATMEEARASVALSQDPEMQTCTIDTDEEMDMSDKDMSDKEAREEAERRTQEERDKWDKRTK